MCNGVELDDIETIRRLKTIKRESQCPFRLFDRGSMHGTRRVDDENHFTGHDTSVLRDFARRQKHQQDVWLILV